MVFCLNLSDSIPNLHPALALYIFFLGGEILPSETLEKIHPCGVPFFTGKSSKLWPPWGLIWWPWSSSSMIFVSHQLPLHGTFLCQDGYCALGQGNQKTIRAMEGTLWSWKQCRAPTKKKTMLVQSWFSNKDNKGTNCLFFILKLFAKKHPQYFGTLVAAPSVKVPAAY